MSNHDFILDPHIVFELFPLLPESISRHITTTSVIIQLQGDINTVILIDDKYILRAKKIQLFDFDDVGGCGNFKAAVDYVESHHFRFHPNNLILEKITTVNGEKIEYLLYEKAPGISLNDYMKSHSDNEIETVIRQIANLMNQLHCIQAPYYGFFHGQRFNSWNDFILYWLDKQELYIRKNETLTNEEILQVKSIFMRNDHVLSLTRPVVIHLDLKPENIIIGSNGAINCIIDWDNARGGDFAADVSYTIEHIFKYNELARFSPIFLDEYRKTAQIQNWGEFMLKYRLYSLFYAYKLLPVHAIHASRKKNVVNLARHVRKMITLFDK